MSIPWFYEPLEGIEEEMLDGNMTENRWLKVAFPLCLWI